MQKNQRVIIIGAGLAGLSAAYHKKSDYLLLERNNRVGGLCRTENYNGFLFDHSIHILYSRDPYATDLIQNVLLKGNLHVQLRESYVYSHGVYTEYPFQAHTYGLPADVIKECILGLIEAKYENRHSQPAGLSLPKPPSNFEEWIYRTFGRGIAKHFMIPYNEKLWGIDLKRMNYDWIAERVPMPKLDEVLDGALSPPQKKYGPNREFWYPKQGGIEALPRGFLPYVQDNLRTNATVTKIDSHKKRVQVNGDEWINYQSLISTLPLPKLIHLLGDVEEDVLAASCALEYNIVHTVNLGVNRPFLSSYHWVYFPQEDFIFHRISFPMNFSPSLVPPKTSSIMAEISESRYKPVKKETLISEVICNLKKVGILKKDDEILIAKVLTLNPAYIIYDLNHRRHVAKILSYLESQNIYSCGRFGEWEYLNMDHSILSGKNVGKNC